METNGFGLEVRVHGNALREFKHAVSIENNVTNLTYLEGRNKSDYTIRVHNYNAFKVLAVLSVDGLNVMTGVQANLAVPYGYVVDPNSYLDVPGWRLDDDSVAKFVFDSKQASYAARQGDVKNSGVIGCAFFIEEFVAEPYFVPTPVVAPFSYPIWLVDPNPPFTYTESKTDAVDLDTTYTYTRTHTYTDTQGHAPAPAPAPAPVLPPHRLGTDFGKRQTFNTESAVFTPQAQPVQVLTLHYATRKALLKAGVDMKPRPKVYIPQAFAGTACTPPKGWKPLK